MKTPQSESGHVAHVVCGCDDNYVFPLSVALHSLVSRAHSEGVIHIYVLDDGISDEGCNYLDRVARMGEVNTFLHVLRPNLESISGLNTDRYFSRAAYLRLLMGSLLPKNVRKAIYIDCDLVFRRDIFDLWGESLQGGIVRAVQDFGIPYAAPSLGIAKLGIARHEKLGIDPYAPYFNSGLMLIDLQEWRSRDIGVQAIEYVRLNNTNIRCHDQEALNVVIGNDWEPLDPRWNVTYLIYDVEDWPDTPFKQSIECHKKNIINDVWVMHYAGTRKPWAYSGVHPARQWFFEEVQEMD